ncbi:obscurin-like protein 1 [Ptychodera flava]|uniref:obscurin-like protein 1 n=1 Tax=Ptychodera flava TaxID=63121 RepID=UPI00396A7F52
MEDKVHLAAPEQTSEEERVITVETNMPVAKADEAKWFKDGDEIDLTDSDKYERKVKDGKAMLVIKDVSKGDTAKYECRSGDKESTHKVKVTEDEASIVHERKDATLITDIPLDDVSEMKWFKDGNEIDLDETDKYNIKVEDGRAVLEIQGVDTDDEGSYTCIVGDKESTSKLLIPQDEKEKTIRDKKDHVTLETNVPFDDISDVTWLKDGIEVDLTDIDKFEVKDQSGKVALVIKDIGKDDEGKYSCQVKDEEVSIEMHISEEGPQKVPVPKVVEKKDYEEVTLETNLPIEDIGDAVWLKDGVEIDITDSDKYVVKADNEKAILVIKNVGPDDEALYTCKAGDKKVHSNLVLSEADTIGKVKIERQKRQEAILETDLPVSDVSEITWLKDGSVIDTTDTDKYDVRVDDGKAVLVVKDIDAEDEAKYICKVRDKEASTMLIMPQEDIKTDVTEQTRVILESDIPIDDVHDVTWFKDGKEIDRTDVDKYLVKEGGGKAVLVITDVQEDDEAKYTCQVGDKESSTKLVVPKGIEIAKYQSYCIPMSHVHLCMNDVHLHIHPYTFNSRKNCIPIFCQESIGHTL